MIYLFHGENQVQSRRALVNLKKNYEPSAVRVLTEVQIPEFAEACEARSLFSERRLVVVEAANCQALACDRRVLDYLEGVPETTDLAFWVGGTLRRTHPLLRLSLRVGEVRCFKRPKEKPFPFLDALGRKEAKKACIELQKLFSQGESEIGLLHLIAWEIRNLIKVKDCRGNPGMSPYVFKKAKSQSRNFSERELVGLFGRVLEADVAVKTGSDPRLVLDKLVYEIAGDQG